MRPDAAEASEQDPGDTPIIVTVSQTSRATATRDSETGGKNASGGGNINSEDEDAYAPVQEATGGTESPPAYPNTLHGVALAKSLAKRKKKELRGKVSQLGGRVRNASTPRAALPPGRGVQNPPASARPPRLAPACSPQMTVQRKAVEFLKEGHTEQALEVPPSRIMYYPPARRVSRIPTERVTAHRPSALR